ncbi:MAG: hypothetical protein JW769_05245 [Parachlamydiales bacterium]|nr:hypothetical protein [Parachlamydiales bacterium]
MKRTLFFLFFPFLLWAQFFPKIYDCFTFFNEMELLEIRLHEMYPYVDKFVLVEACETHRTATPKPFYFDMFKERFAPFLDKIIHIKLEEPYSTDDPWEREHWHRNQIMRGLTGCHDNDIIMISDLDEIIPGKIIPHFNRLLCQHKSLYLQHQMYRWFLNRSCNCRSDGSAIVRYRDVKKNTPQGIRELAIRGRLRKGLKVGWHFSSMGGYPKIIEKYRAIVEGHDDTIYEQNWRKEVDHHRLVPIDASYPQFVQENIPYFIEKKMIDLES